jgi:mono/diheme cytochrome c family protein
MPIFLSKIHKMTAVILLSICTLPSLVHATGDIKRGKYLVQLGGCNDCHTPGYFLGKSDTSRYLGGSDVGFFVPNLGTFVGPNITSDTETGIGKWSEDDIVNALQKGLTPDGRELAPVMPWSAFVNLTKAVAQAIAAYLKSLPPVHSAVPGPFGPSERVTVPTLRVVAPDPSAN